MPIDLKTIDKIDKILFNINDKYKNSSISNILPIAISIEDKYYQISGFISSGNQYIFLGKYSPYEAINLFVSLINNISFKVLSEIYSLCEKLNANINNINIFKEKNIKGQKNFETLKKSLNLPDVLLNFIDKKDVPLKIVALIINQKSNVINFISEHIARHDLSSQNFRIFVEKVCDFKEIIPEIYDENFKFMETKSKDHIELEEQYSKLIASFQNIKINNIDNFETSKLHISFDINNLLDYENIIAILNKNRFNILSFYKFLKEKGLD